MKLSTHDAIYRAPNPIRVIGETDVQIYAPIGAWLVGFATLPLFAALFLIPLGSMPLAAWLLAGGAALGVVQWVAGRTGGDHRLRDVWRTVATELRTTRRHRKASKPRKTRRVHLAARPKRGNVHV